VFLGDDDRCTPGNQISLGVAPVTVRPGLIVAALLALLPVLAGCAGIVSTSSSSSTQASSNQGAVGVAGAAQPASGVVLLQQGDVPAKPPPGFSCPATSLRGCFSESTMSTYFAYVLPIVDKSVETTWQSRPLPAHVYFIPDGVQEERRLLESTR
jgi:hypothetical protein